MSYVFNPFLGNLDSDSGGSVGGTGTANYVARWISATALSTGQLFDNGSNVGVGTVLPGAIFEVNKIITSTVGESLLLSKMAIANTSAGSLGNYINGDSQTTDTNSIADINTSIIGNRGLVIHDNGLVMTGSLYGVYSQVINGFVLGGANASAASNLWGGAFQSVATNTSNTNGAVVGGLFYAARRGAGGTNTFQAAGDFYNEVSGGTVGTMFGIRVLNDGLTGGSISTNQYTAYLDSFTTTGTTMNGGKYQLYLEQGDGIIAQYSIYQLGTTGQKNIINANTRVGGSTDPTVALDVTGATLISTTLGVTGQTSLNAQVGAFAAAVSSANLKVGAGSTLKDAILLTSGSLKSSAVAGGIGFLTDDIYFTITTGTARKKFVLDDGTALTSGRVPFATTNGRLTDDADMTFATDTLTVTKIAATTFTGNITLSTKDIVTDTTTGTKIGTGTTQKLGLYNTTPIVQGAALTTQLTSITHTAPGTPDYAIQDLTNIAPYGFASQDEGNTVLSVIANLQTRVAQLEARLGTATGIGIFA